MILPRHTLDLDRDCSSTQSSHTAFNNALECTPCNVVLGSSSVGGGAAAATSATNPDKAAADKSSSGIGIQATVNAEPAGKPSSNTSASNSNPVTEKPVAAATTLPSATMAGPATSASAGATAGKESPAGGLAKSPVNPPGRPPSGGNTAAQPPTSAATSNNSAPSSNNNTRTTASGAAGSGTASPSGYKPFDYSQPLSTYSPANYGSGMRRSPAGTPGAGQTSANASPNSNPIAAGFAYGASGHRAGSGLNPSNTSQQQQQQSGNASPGAGGNRAPQVQSRTGNNATPLTAPPIVSRTSGSAPSAAAGGLSAAAIAELEGIANSAAALASNGRLGGPISPLPKLPSPATGPGKALPGQQSGQASAQQQAHNRHSGAYGNATSLSAANTLATRDPRTPNPVTESLLSRSPLSAGATSATSAAPTNRPPSNPAEQSRTGGIATPLAPGASASSGSARPIASTAGSAASPPLKANKDTPGQKSTGQTGQQNYPVVGLTWKSLIDGTYGNPYGPNRTNQASRTQSPNQRAGHWFNPLAVKQQSSAQASAQAQAQAQSAAQRPPSSTAASAGSPQQTAQSPTAASASTGNAGPGAQQQTNKRRTASTSAATPPYNMASIYGNRPGSASTEAKDGAQPQRAVTASPIVGAANVPNATANSAASGQAGSAAAKTASPGHQNRPSYSMTYGERLQQLQAQSARERERDKEAREREMREREKAAAAIVAGPKTAHGFPPVSITRSPYYGMTGGTSSVPASAGKAASPPTAASGTAQSPLSPPRKPADRPSSTSAFGYLFGGGGASRVATDAKTGTTTPHAAGVTSGGAAGQSGQSGHYRAASSGAAGQAAIQQQQQAAAYTRQGLPTSSTPVSRTQNTGLGLSAGAAQANWRATGHNGAATASTASQQTAADRKPDVSPQLAAQQALAQKAVETADFAVSAAYSQVLELQN